MFCVLCDLYDSPTAFTLGVPISLAPARCPGIRPISPQIGRVSVPGCPCPVLSWVSWVSCLVLPVHPAISSFGVSPGGGEAAPSVGRLPHPPPGGALRGVAGRGGGCLPFLGRTPKNRGRVCGVRSPQAAHRSRVCVARSPVTDFLWRDKTRQDPSHPSVSSIHLIRPSHPSISSIHPIHPSSPSIQLVRCIQRGRWPSNGVR